MLATACWTDTDSRLHQRRSHAEALAAARAARAAHGSGPGRAQVGARPGSTARPPRSPGPPVSGALPRAALGMRRACCAPRPAGPLRPSQQRRAAASPSGSAGRPAWRRNTALRPEAWRHRLPSPSGACRKGPPGGPWCGPAIAAGLLARLPQLLLEPPAPTPVPLSWHTGRGGRYGGMPRRGPRKHLLARRTPERAHSDRSGAGVRGGGVGAVPPAWPGVPRSWRAQRALLLARLPHAAQPANAKAQRRLAARMAIARCRGSEGSGYATRGFANHAASRPGRRPQGGEGGFPRQELAIRGMYANLRPGEDCGHQPRSVSRARFHPRRPSNPRRKRRTRAPAEYRQGISPGSPVGRRRHARGRLQTQASERSREPRQRARSVRFVWRQASQQRDQGLPDCIVVQLGVGGDLGGGDGPQGMVSARGEAHMAKSSQAHWRSGSRGNCSSRWRSSCARVVAQARTYSEWPTGVPNTSRPHSARGRSPRHTSVPSSATPGGGGPPAGGCGSKKILFRIKKNLFGIKKKFI